MINIHTKAAHGLDEALMKNRLSKAFGILTQAFRNAKPSRRGKFFVETPRVNKKKINPVQKMKSLGIKPVKTEAKSIPEGGIPPNR